MTKYWQWNAEETRWKPGGPSTLPEAFLLGYNCFTTFIWPPRHACWTKLSLLRLKANAEALGLEPLPVEAMLEALNTLAFEQDEVLRLTGYPEPFGLKDTISPNEEPLPTHWLLLSRGKAPAWPKELPPAEMELISRDYVHPSSTVKHGSLAGSLSLRLHTTESPSQDVIWVAPDGSLTEATTSNVFFLKQGTLYTAPADRVLNGIARRQLLKAAKQLKLPVIEEAVTLPDLSACDGALVCNSVQGLRAVKQIDATHFSLNDKTFHQLYKHWLKVAIAG